MPEDRQIIVFVHGWSVRNTNTYGELPARLRRELLRTSGSMSDIRNIWLGKYISFSDEVRMEDVSRAFQAALIAELGDEIRAGRRFAVITHSTGGPVVRDWWNRFYRESPSAGVCPMSHLVMLAPANFGSALAQLGKGRIGRIKAWFEGVEPGTGLLDWLELGSPQSWDLNVKWITSSNPLDEAPPVFQFVLTGQSIDHALYDHLNSYTDEAGSDGVVRTAAANLNAKYLRLVQQAPAPMKAGARKLPSVDLSSPEIAASAPRTAFALVPGRSHSGSDMGILRSVKNDRRDHPTVNAVLRCLTVASAADYTRLCDEFDAENRVVRENERAELYRRRLLPDRWFFHDAHSMVIFRIRDDRGHVVRDFDLKLTAGRKGRVSPDFLPEGFFVDRQKNQHDAGTLTYYFNYDAMVGSDAVLDPGDPRHEAVLRDKLPGAESLGLELVCRPDDGFVHYYPASLQATPQVLEHFIGSDQTSLIEIVVRRTVREGTFRLTSNLDPEDFTKQPPGDPILWLKAFDKSARPRGRSRALRR